MQLINGNNSLVGCQGEGDKHAQSASTYKATVRR